MEYRNYQIAIIEKGTDILKKHGLLYLAMEVRTGKTLTSLGICEEMGAENVPDPGVRFCALLRAVPPHVSKVSFVC